MEPWNKGKKLPADPCTHDEVRRMIAACNSPSRNRLRNKAMLALLWRCGPRSDELRSLRVSDVRFDEDGTGTIRIMRPKGAKRGKPPREIGFDSRTGYLVSNWMTRRWDEPVNDWLFPTGEGQKIAGQQLRNMVQAIARAAKIERRVSPHSLRHTFARDLYDEGVGIVHIQHALGHSDLKTTAEYLGSIGATDVVAVTRERNW